MGTAYGQFDDAAREYVITPARHAAAVAELPRARTISSASARTPRGGYTFWRDAKLRRLTRYRYNNVPLDLGGRYLYVHDGGTVWNPGWKPTKTPLDRYECRHGLGYTRILGAKDGVEVELLFFVPPGENVELWKTTVRNIGGEPKDLTLFSYVEFCFYEALNDMTNYQRTYSIGEVEVEGSAIYHTTEYRERRDHYTLFGCTREIDGFDTVARRLRRRPQRPARGARCRSPARRTGSIAHGWNPIGSHQLDLRPRAGRARRPSRSCSPTSSRATSRSSSGPASSNKSSGPRAPRAVSRAGRGRRRRSTRCARCWDDLLCAVPGRLPRPSTRSGCSTPGTSTSAWRRSTSRARRASTRPASAAAWASATRTRTCSASST